MNLLKKREIAARIRERLLEIGQTQTWLASQLGVSKTIVGRYVDEEDPQPPAKGKKRFTEIADALGKSVDWLWDGVEPPQSQEEDWDLMASAMIITKEETDARGLTITPKEWRDFAKIAYRTALANPARTVDRNVLGMTIDLFYSRPRLSPLPKQH